MGVNRRREKKGGAAGTPYGAHLASKAITRAAAQQNKHQNRASVQTDNHRCAMRIERWTAPLKRAVRVPFGGASPAAGGIITLCRMALAYRRREEGRRPAMACRRLARRGNNGDHIRGRTNILRVTAPTKKI